MEDKKHSQDEINVSEEQDLTVSEEARLDAIIEFYKDKPLSNETKPTDSDTSAHKNFVSGLINRIFKKSVSDTASVGGSINDDEGIHSGSYGMNYKERRITAYIITALICISILSGSYFLALLMPGDTETVNRYADELRNSDDYKSLSTQYNTISHEVSQLRASNDAKKENVESISDYDNSKAALRAEIAAKTEELNAYNAQITEKREIIASLDAIIAQKTPSVITLNAGKYVIGTNIAAGKYFITGSGTFSAASSSNVSKYNLSLGNTSHEVVLEKGDIIKINATTQFTSAN